MHLQQNVVCFGGLRRLERIEIENFKGIRKLVIDMPRAGQREAWLMLVGENGVGKSSILQAVWLALMPTPGLDARRLLTHGQDEGVIRVHLATGNPITVTFSRRSPQLVRPRRDLWSPRRHKADAYIDRMNAVLRQLLPTAEIKMAELSDGSRALVALVREIVMGLDDGEQAEGIVLVDEIGTHLHPTWKLEIVARLRQVFPRLFFLATTHDPLCLRGLRPGEVVVLRKSDGNVSAEYVTHCVDHLRADQLLTSPLFGLLTTRGPEFQRTTDRYSQLLGKKQRSNMENDDLCRLRTKLTEILA